MILQISDAVPDLLLQYIPDLIYASNFLSAQFNEDMSASGVSEAFLKAESLLVPAFIAWSSVIGTFFGFESTLTTSRNHKRKLTGSSMVTEDKQLVTPSGTVRLRRFSARSRHESFTSYPSTPVKASSPIDPSATTMGLPQTSSRQSSMTSDERESPVSGKKHARKRETRLQDRRRFPPFREFAILPTQRVTRYVLLYKGALFSLGEVNMRYLTNDNQIYSSIPKLHLRRDLLWKRLLEQLLAWHRNVTKSRTRRTWYPLKPHQLPNYTSFFGVLTIFPDLHSYYSKFCISRLCYCYDTSCPFSQIITSM